MAGALVTTVAGSVQGSVDGYGSAAKFNWPLSVAINEDEPNTLYVAEHTRVRRIDIDTGMASCCCLQLFCCTSKHPIAIIIIFFFFFFADIFSFFA